MLLNPAVLALSCCSLLVAILAMVAAAAGIASVVGWNPEDAGPRQLARERRLVLVEAAVALAAGWQMLSLVLFVVTVDRLHPLITGAMCAAGTLNANPLGYPTLALKLAAFGFCGLWLLVHRTSPAATNTGLVRAKHLSVLPFAALLATENGMQLRYFADLDPAVITSCCATVFTAEAEGLGAGLASLPAGGTRAAFVLLLALTVGAGAWSTARRCSPTLFCLLSVALGATAIASVVVWVAPSVYELPAHHCPFCLLSADYGCTGYLLYLLLAVGTLAGAGSGLLHGLRRLDPLGSIHSAVERRLCLVSMTGFGLFSLVSLWPGAAMGLRILRAVGP